MYPIYYIVAEQRWIQNMNQVNHIIAVFECELEDVNELYQKHVAPLSYSGIQVMTYIFARVPNSTMFSSTPAAKAEPTLQYIIPRTIAPYTYKPPEVVKDEPEEEKPNYDDSFWTRQWKENGGAEDL